MRILIFFILIALTDIAVYAQEEHLYFSEAISLNLPKYEEKAGNAYRTEDIERADFLFDSLVQHCLRGSYLDNFKAHDLKKKEVYLETFEKPVLLRTQASWLVPSKGEISALNKLAKEYGEQLEILVLYWDDHKTARKMARKYEKSIQVLYVDELQNESPEVIRTLKHSLGLPTTFLLDSDKKIVDIRRGLTHPYGIGFEKSFDLHYNSVVEGISLLLLDQETQRTKLAKRR